MDKDRKKFVVAGFQLGAAAAAVRKPGRLDLGLILADPGTHAAALFTTNQVKAPSVLLNQRRLGNGAARALIVNSGNANTCVGPAGMRDAQRVTAAVATRLGLKSAEVLVNSTGVIGEPLPVGRVLAAIPALADSLRPDGLADFARAIITTDTHVKLAVRDLKLAGGRARIAAAAKGAGMIGPNLATMLVYLLTDAAAPPALLKPALAEAADDSLNALTIDGDTSTSDSVILMASGAGRVSLESAAARRAFTAGLADLCLELAETLARDGEGATKMFKILVRGARTRAEADRIARRVANSPLVKTAFHAGDPNWGRIMAAVGSAGVKLNPDRIDVRFELGKKTVEVVKAGAISPRYREAAAAKLLAQTDFIVAIDLRRGGAERAIITCDFSADYVKINAEYRT